MPSFIRDGLSPHSAIVSMLAASLVLSLLCSLSIQESLARPTVAATADAIQPLEVGDAAPRFVVQTVEDDAFTFDPAALKRPAIIITFRGGWCPFCNMHLSELRTVVPEIAELGVDVLFLSGDRPELLYASLAADTQADIADLGYRIYSDADAQAAIAFGIAFKAADATIAGRHAKGQDIAESSMLRHGVLPVPAVYAIDRDGKIVFSFVEANYRVRLPADKLLAAAQEIAR